MSIDNLRERIDRLDTEIVRLLGERLKVAREIGEEKETVGPDSVIDSPARIPHCWHNQSDQRLRVLVVKVPRPTEQTRLL